MSNSLNSGEHWIIQFVEDLPEMKVGDDRDGMSFLVETTSVKNELFGGGVPLLCINHSLVGVINRSLYPINIFLEQNRTSGMLG